MDKNIAQTTDKVGQLVSSENYFAALAKEKGIKAAFLKVSDETTLLFRPKPVKALEYFKNQDKDDSGVLSWEPAFARISKSNDWGFTTGPYTYKESDTSTTLYYGQYLSVWKKNKKGVWKLALDLGISHPKPKKPSKLLFNNPASEKFLRQHSENRLEQRKDIVLSSDQLLATILKADNRIARNEFLSDDTRLLFPGHEPIIGKDSVMEFWNKQNALVSSKPIEADRAYSGELAFTYGTATIKKIGESKDYNYVRVWEVQPGFTWNVIIEIFTPAGN
jgi:ketosteroid isomerase-like protein